MPVKPIKAIGSKESGIEAATGVMEAGRVYLPQDAPWLSDSIREAAAFPDGKHDDMLDALVQVLNKEAFKPSSMQKLLKWAWNQYLRPTRFGSKHHEKPTHRRHFLTVVRLALGVTKMQKM